MKYYPQISGTTMLGVGVIPGTICNIDGREGGLHTTRIAWDFVSSDNNAVVYAYVNGSLSGRVAGVVETMDIADLVGGSHSVQLVVLSEHETPPMYLLDLKGRQGLVYWDASSDAETVGYRIYNDDNLITEIRDIVISPLINQIPNETALNGIGRITVWGNVPEGLTVNEIMELEILDDGVIGYTTTSNSDIAQFVSGGVVNLLYGVQVGFIDSLDSYKIGDKWFVKIGPKTEFLTDSLQPGNYSYFVSAIDLAGNESPQVPCEPFRILEIPNPVKNVTISFDKITSVIDINCEVPSGATGINLYTNYNPHTEKFEDCIAVDGLPFLQSIDGEFAFPINDLGKLKFYLRPYDDDDEREDVYLYNFNVPPEPEDIGIILSQPFGLTVIPTAGGKWRLDWFYAFEEGDSISEFIIYRHTPNAAIDYNNDEFDRVVKTAGTEFPIRKFSYETDTAESDPTRLSVRATNGTMVTSNTDYVVLIPDSIAPYFDGPVYGGAA